MVRKIIYFTVAVAVAGLVFWGVSILSNKDNQSTDKPKAIDPKYEYLDDAIFEWKAWDLGTYKAFQDDISKDVNIAETRDAYMYSLNNKAIELFNDTVTAFCQQSEYRYAHLEKCKELTNVLENEITNVNQLRYKMAQDELQNYSGLYYSIWNAGEYAKNKPYDSRTYNNYISILNDYLQNKTEAWENAGIKQSINSTVNLMRRQKTYHENFDAKMSLSKNEADCDDKFSGIPFYIDSCKTVLRQKQEEEIND